MKSMQYVTVFFMVLTISIASLLAGPSPRRSPAERDAGGSDLETLKTEYEHTRDDIINEYAVKAADLGREYLKSLKDLQKMMIEKGDLKNVSAVAAEIERFQREKKILDQASETTLVILRDVQMSYKRQIAKLKAQQALRPGSPRRSSGQAGQARTAKRAVKAGPGKKKTLVAIQEARGDRAKISHSAIGAEVSVSSTHAGEPGEMPAAALVDGDVFTRWSSDYSEPQEIVVRLARPMKLNKIRLHWEKASATKYCVYLSEDGRSWKSVFLYMKTSREPASRIDEIDLHNMFAGWIRLDLQNCINNEWGFSLYEIEVIAAKRQNI